MPNMKKILKPALLLLGGLSVGGGAAYATTSLLGPPEVSAAAGEDAGPTTFVEVDNVLAPLVLPEGERLAGYATFNLALEVPEEQAEFVTARLPMLRHEINMRTYLSPMASGPDGSLPDLEVFRSIVREAAQVAFGKGAVATVAIESALPA